MKYNCYKVIGRAVIWIAKSLFPPLIFCVSQVKVHQSAQTRYLPLNKNNIKLYFSKISFSDYTYFAGRL